MTDTTTPEPDPTALRDRAANLRLWATRNIGNPNAASAWGQAEALTAQAARLEPAARRTTALGAVLR